MKTAITILSVILFSSQMVGAQFSQPDFKRSEKGLEVDISTYKALPFSIKGEGLDRIQLSTERIETICELRLRQARIDPTPAISPVSYFLKISVTVLGEAFSILIEFTRGVAFKATGEEYWTPGVTWSELILGIHGKNPEFVMQSLGKHLDAFLNDYLNSNEKLVKGK